MVNKNIRIANIVYFFMQIIKEEYSLRLNIMIM